MAKIESLMTKRIFSPLVNLYSQRVQLTFLGIFFIINVTLFLSAVPVIHDLHDDKPLHPTYAGAADGQRYWGVGKNLVERSTFDYEYMPGDLRPLQRGGPVPPLVYAALMRLTGFENAPLLIVALQCLLLYFVSLLSRKLAAIFPANPNLVQGLILFNPSLIGLAHHAQSEIIFLLFFTLLLCLCLRLFASEKPEPYLSLSIGIASGLLLLTRPAGLTFFLALPLVLLTSVYLSRRKLTGVIKPLVQQVLPAFLVAALIVSPWVLHSYQTFGGNGFTNSSVPVLRLNHMLLKNESQSDGNLKPEEQMLRDLIEHTAEEGLDRCCVINDMGSRSDVSRQSRYQCQLMPPPGDCDQILVSSHLTVMVQAHTIGDWGRALLSAWISTYIGPGVAPIASYLGLDRPDLVDLSIDRGVSRYWAFLTAASQGSMGYFALFLAGLVFSLASRISGVLGIAVSIRNYSLRPAHFFLISTIVIFTATYLFIGVSRFRAHLEPILAIYAAIGLSQGTMLIRQFFEIRR